MHATELAAPLSPTRGLDFGGLPLSSARETEWIPGGGHQVFLTAVPLVAADLLAGAIALAIAWQLTMWISPQVAVDWPNLTWGLVLALVVTHLATGLYPGIGLSAIGELRRTSISAACIAIVFAVVARIQPTANIATSAAIATTCVLLFPWTFLVRRLARTLLGHFSWWGQSALIVGDDEGAASVYRFLRDRPGLGLRPLGIVGYRVPQEQAGGGSRFLGPVSCLNRLVREHNRPWLVMARPLDVPERLSGAWRQCAVMVSRLDGSPSLWRRASACLDWPGDDSRAGVSPRVRWVKRSIDLVLALVASVLLLPVLLPIALLVRLSSPGPAIFRQERVGLHGRRFVCWKFRTMVCDGQRVLDEYLDACPERRAAWERDHKLPHDPRVTTIGRLLRKTSLDELPQLWNVLRGDMSLVGPRPILASEIPDFGEHFESFSSVLPGITGLWQVSGRNQTTYAEHIELDSFYARHWSLWLDLYILAVTVRVVLLRQGAY